jgi:hypothetical protein
MPSTYTLNNGIELIGTGEQSGTWGDTTNTNLDLLDAALDGQVTITLGAAGSSGSPNALPITDGTASNGRNRMVVFADGGDLGATAYVQLTPNDAEKIIYIRNSLSGSRSVILFQGTYNASNDYEVPAGTTAVVYFDGAGAGAVAANVFNNAYFDGLRLGSVSVTAILDEDNMASDSATALATQQSIKAYVDAQVATVDTLAEILAIGNTTGATDIAVDSAQKVQFRDAAIYINSSVDGQLDIVADTEIQIAATTVDVNGALDVSGTALVTGVLTTTAATVHTGGITMPDNAKAIFGAGSDLQIYHDGSNSYIDDAGTGVLNIRAESFIALSDMSNNVYLTGTSGGAVGLRFNDAEKLATTATGIDVTGTLDVNGGANSTQAIFSGTAGRGLVISTESVGAADEGVILNATASGTTGKITFQTNDATSLELAGNGGTGTFHQGLIVNEDSAASGDFRVESDTNTHALFVDAGNNRIGLFNSAPSAPLHLIAGSSGGSLSDAFLISDSAYVNIAMYSGGADGEIRIGAAGVLRGSYKAQYAGTRSANDFHVGVQDTTGMFSIDGAGAALIINERGADTDFRVESNSNAYALFVDAGGDYVNIGTSGNFSSKLTVVGNKTLTLGIPTNQLSVIDKSSMAAGVGGAITLWGNYTTGGGDAEGASIEAIKDNATSGNYGFGMKLSTRTHGSTMDERLSLSNSSTVFNENGFGTDFRVESDTNANGLMLDASTSTVGVNRAPNSVVALSVNATATNSSTYAFEACNSGNATKFIVRSDGYSGFYKSSNAGGFIHNTDGAITITPDAGGHFVFNEDGVDADFRVESDSNAHMLFVDAGNNQVVVGTSTPITGVGAMMTIGGGADTRLVIDGSNSSGLYFLDSGAQGITIRNASGDLEVYGVASGEFVFNEDGIDTDFRVESSGSANMLFVDAGSNVVCVGTSDISVAGNTGSARGINLNANGYIEVAAYQEVTAYFNRLNNDGTIINFLQNGVTEGTISVAGTTVSYNGGHLARWSQLADNTRDDTLLKGTVLTNLDQMAVWGDEDNEQLNCMAKSSVEGDANVAGVFVNWDNDDKTYTADMNIAMTGDMIIRIAQGTTVARGDLLMSAGDGTAKPQGDDIVRGKTIAKITSTHVTCTYDDGSYCVPCVLMAC